VLEALALGHGLVDDGVADGEAGVDQTDHVAGIGIVEGRAIPGHQGRRPRQPQLALDLAPVDVLHHLVAFEAARADADERQTVAVLGIHIRLDLEDIGAERRGRLQRP
jgi:hypothetical protein